MLKEWAIRYAQLGWPVLPVLGDKRPACDHGASEATTSLNQISAWWDAMPNALIGICCRPGGIACVDVDQKGDRDGFATLQAYWNQGYDFPPTCCARTPNNGAHFIFRHPGDLANNNGDAFPGVDIRAHNYYFIAPPSMLPDGREYAWTTPPFDLDGTDGIPPAKFPEWLKPPTTRSVGGQPAEPLAVRQPDEGTLTRAVAYAQELAQSAPAVEGQGGHARLLWACTCMIRGFLLPPDVASGILLAHYNPACKPPWNLDNTKDRREWEHKIHEAFARPCDKPAGWLLADRAYNPEPADVEQQRDAVSLLLNRMATEARATHGTGAEIDAEEQANDPEYQFLTQPSGLLGELCSWINRTAIKPQPLLTLGASLAFCGALFGRKVAGPTDLRTNVYCLGIGRSGCGKNRAIEQLLKLARPLGMTNIVGGEDVSSDTAIIHWLEDHPSCLFIWDEVGSLFSKAKSATQTTNLSQFIPLLMKLFSRANTAYNAKIYARGKGKEEQDQSHLLIQPCLCVYGTSTPVQFTGSLSPSELIDGWLARCLVFQTYQNPRATYGPHLVDPAPESLRSQVAAWWARRTEPGDIAGAILPQDSRHITEPQPIPVPETPGAADIFQRFGTWVESQTGDEMHQVFFARANEHARKIALICAASDSFDNPTISEANADYGCRLIQYLYRGLWEKLFSTVAENIIEKTNNKIADIVRAAGSKGITRSGITRKTQWVRRREREQVLTDLLEAGRIVDGRLPSDTDARVTRFWVPEFKPAEQPASDTQ